MPRTWRGVGHSTNGDVMNTRFNEQLEQVQKDLAHNLALAATRDGAETPRCRLASQDSLNLARIQRLSLPFLHTNL
jgi:hypothetical protein